MGDPSNLIFSWRTTMMLMVCVPILISVVLLLLKTEERVPSRYLAGFFFAAVVAIGPQIIGFAGFYQVWPGLTFFPFATDLWLGPLFYLHARELISGPSSPGLKLLLVPGVLQTTYYTWAYLSLGDYKQKWAFNESFHEPYIAPGVTFLAIVLIVFALISVWRMSKQYKQYLLQTQSAVTEFDPVWLDRMILVMLAGGAIYAVIETAMVFSDLSYQAAFPFQVILMATLAWLSVEAVWRLSHPYPKLVAEEFAPEPEEVEAQDELKDWQAEAQEILHNVETRQWFLEPRFSLRELTKRLASNEAYVSRSINQGLGQSFNEFINRLRVKHAQNLILNSDDKMLTIALDSGFNSKATFNRVFRDIAKVTPSQFKQRAKEKGLKS